MQLDLQHHTQVYLGLYERELHRCLGVLSREAVTAIDAGAADGAYSLYFLKRPKVRSVYAFEPDPSMRKLLRSNIGLNGLEGDARLRISDSPVGAGGASHTIALDDLYDSIELPVVVKVDVEGHEVEVLEGARRLLGRGGSSWIIETHSPELERDCVDMLERKGLTVTIVSPAWWRFAIPEARPIAHNRWLIAHEAGSIPA
jgi:hypothetical protein